MEFGLLRRRGDEIMHSYIKYKHVIHDPTSGLHHPKGKPLIAVLDEEGIDGWTVCGITRDSEYHTDIYFYREVIVEEMKS